MFDCVPGEISRGAIRWLDEDRSATGVDTAPSLAPAPALVETMPEAVRGRRAAARSRWTAVVESTFRKLGSLALRGVEVKKKKVGGGGGGGGLGGGGGG